MRLTLCRASGSAIDATNIPRQTETADTRYLGSETIGQGKDYPKHLARFLSTVDETLEN